MRPGGWQAPAGAYLLPRVGNDAPTTARKVGLPPLWVSRQLRCPKVSKGERREAGIQWIQPPKAVSDPEFRQTTSGAHGSANRADCLPRGKPFGAPAGAYPCPGWGMSRRLRRGWWGYRPMGSRQLRCPKVSKGRAESPLVRPQAHTPCPRWGMARRLRREW